jgi:glycosyltransferase involved in cell wall biosynthesis
VNAVRGPLSGPSVSVIIPARNAAATIGRTIRAFAAERDLIAEILVVDDGSLDGTDAAAFKAAGESGLPLTIIPADCRNPGAARNRALDRAGGEFIFFIDADDEPIAGGLRALVGAARTSGASLAVGGSIRRSPGRPDDLRLPHRYVRDRALNVRNLLRNVLRPLIIGSALVRRAAATDARFPENLSLDEDTCYWVMVLKVAAVVEVAAPVVLYHFDEARMAHRYAASPRGEFVRIAAAYSRLVAHGADRQTVQWRKSWLAFSFARQAMRNGRYALARRMFRPVLANPDFRYAWRTFRYRLRIGTGVTRQRLRLLRPA